MDLDGVLCESEYWGEGDPKPIQKNINIVNRLALKHFVVIHTARRYEWAEHTLNWLDRHGVRYHAIRFGKMPCDVLCDDKAVPIESL